MLVSLTQSRKRITTLFFVNRVMRLGQIQPKPHAPIALSANQPKTILTVYTVSHVSLSGITNDLTHNTNSERTYGLIVLMLSLKLENKLYPDFLILSLLVFREGSYQQVYGGVRLLLLLNRLVFQWLITNLNSYIVVKKVAKVCGLRHCSPLFKLSRTSLCYMIKQLRHN